MESINTKFIFYPLVILSIIFGVFLVRQETDVEIYGPYFGFVEEYLQKELDLISDDLNISIKYFPVIDVEAYMLENFDKGELSQTIKFWRRDIFFHVYDCISYKVI